MAAFNQILILYHLKTPENQIISSGVFYGVSNGNIGQNGKHGDMIVKETTGQHLYCPSSQKCFKV